MVVDGSLVVASSSGVVWAGIVRGYLHPEDGLVAEPYRLPGCSRAPRDLVEERFLQCLQRHAPVVPLGSVISVYTPWRLLEHARARLPREILGFASILPIDLVGITGSYAIGCESWRSDVDLVVYTSEPGELARELRRLKIEGKIRQCAADRVIEKRGSRPDYAVSRAHIEESVVESCFQERPYTIRVLRSRDSARCLGEEARRSYGGRVSLVLYIFSEDPDPLLVPSLYRARVLKSLGRSLVENGDEIILESFRTRYADLQEGIYLVRGELFIERSRTVVSPDLWGGVWRLK